MIDAFHSHLPLDVHVPLYYSQVHTTIEHQRRPQLHLVAGVLYPTYPSIDMSPTPLD